jgi:hypothetical protein
MDCCLIVIANVPNRAPAFIHFLQAVESEHGRKVAGLILQIF